MTDHATVRRWVAGYELAWRTTSTDGLAALFTADASYLHSPYEQPVLGLPAIRQAADVVILERRVSALRQRRKSCHAWPRTSRRSVDRDDGGGLWFDAVRSRHRRAVGTGSAYLAATAPCSGAGCAAALRWSTKVSVPLAARGSPAFDE